jgi:hypothetical protein
MVAERSDVATHPGQELELAAGLAGGSRERGPHTVVTRVRILVRMPMKLEKTWRRMCHGLAYL